MQRLRGRYPDQRKEPVGHAGELISMKERLLAAPFERLQPAPTHLSDKPPQARVVSRAVAVEVLAVSDTGRPLGDELLEFGLVLLERRPVLLVELK